LADFFNFFLDGMAGPGCNVSNVAALGLEAEGRPCQGQDFLAAVQASRADAGAFALDVTPPVFRSQVAEPKWKSAALTGAQLIDRAAIVEEEAAAVRVFADTVAVLERIEVPLDEIIHMQVQMVGQRFDLIPGDIDGSRFTRTAGAAPLALKTNAGIKKIGAPLQRIRR
jgi:hypothetical protein